MNCRLKWLGRQFQNLKPYIPTYVRDTSYLHSINDLLPNAYLVTANVDLMYNNIDTSHTIDTVSSGLDELLQRLDFPSDFPLDDMKESEVWIMHSNILEFGYMYLLQLLGAAICTSAAIT
ncbi:hypothetical protein ACHAWF_001600 [Thalassiosira exigua]